MVEQDDLNLRAYDKAVRAETMIEVHMKECEARWGEVIRLFSENKSAVAALSNRVLYAAGSAFFVMLGCLAYFLVRFGLPGQTS